MHENQHNLSPKPLVYITRDIERALGSAPASSYQIVSNDSTYAKEIHEQYPSFVHLVPSKADLAATEEICKNQQTEETLKRLAADILVFKNTAGIEELAQKNGWHLLNPSAALAEKIENKISQIEWLGEDLKKYLPSTIVAKASEIAWKDEPFVIQWAHGHTGTSTILINNAKELEEIKKRFPERLARISRFIKGPSLTLNVVVTPSQILEGNISYQITGMEPFTENQFSTIGNDWSLPHSLLREAELEEISHVAQLIGKKMRLSGWKGLFGIDIMRDEERNQLSLIEINARQPASTTYESFLQIQNRNHGVNGATIFEAHVQALYDQEVDSPLVLVNDGAQVVQRITKNRNHIVNEAAKALEQAGYHVIPYQNTDFNNDLLRIQCDRGIMETHQKFNKRGKEIIEILSGF